MLCVQFLCKTIFIECIISHLFCRFVILSRETEFQQDSTINSICIVYLVWNVICLETEVTMRHKHKHTLIRIHTSGKTESVVQVSLVFPHSLYVFSLCECAEFMFSNLFIRVLWSWIIARSFKRKTFGNTTCCHCFHGLDFFGNNFFLLTQPSAQFLTNSGKLWGGGEK